MSEIFIEAYSFGSIIILGKTYQKDVLLLGKQVISDWWRERGHKVSIEDLKEVIEYQPELLIIGTGQSGKMKVPSDMDQELGFPVKSYPTGDACKNYHRELERGTRVAGAFHLTC